MPQENVVFYNPADELDEDLNINIEKIWRTIWNRRVLLVKVFCSVLAFFILLTFILPKKYKVTADLYINKSNNSNMMEINPYMLEDVAGSLLPASPGADKAINNEIELMKSELVLDKVIRENNIVYKKKWGIIPNKKEGEFLTAEAFYGKGKKLKIDNTKNTSVITIEYTAKKPELAYGVVSSLITNYIELHKELNSEKSKSDTKLLEAEYAKVKEELNKKLNNASGMPVQTMTGIGNISAMSAFSKSAAQAIGNIKSQLLAGEKSQIAVTEEAQKLTQIATKLEWAKMVEQMSDSSKVLVLKEPKLLRPFEKSSPKLFFHIILGCIFGCLTALIALIYVEIKDKKLAYSMLTDNIIFEGKKKQNLIETKIYSYNPQKVLCLSFEQLPDSILETLKNLPNVNIAYYDGTKDFMDKVNTADKIVLTSKINVTDANSYKIVKEVITTQQKEIIFDILI